MTAYHRDSIRFLYPLLALLLAQTGGVNLHAGEMGKNNMTHPSSVASASWRQLPSYPRLPGVAGVIAGVHRGVLLAGGGANFPDAPPWEGGKKVTYDDLHVFFPAENLWHPGGILPEPRGYAAVVSMPPGVLVCGGENAGKVFQDSFWLSWTGQAVSITPGPRLPAATTSPAAAVLGDRVYLAAGFAEGTPRLTRSGFWSLDWKNPEAGWTELPPCPGPSRAQAVMAAVDGAIYLISGIGIAPGADGKPQATYLTDAYRYRPGQGWEKLPDSPRSAIAAPSPAPVSADGTRIYVLGGVDGRLAGKQPRDTRVPGDIIYFDVPANEWNTSAERWPDPVVTSPAVKLGGDWLLVSGETMAGVRTPHVWSVQFGASQPGGPPSN